MFHEGFSAKPLTPAQWEDFTTLFGERGACGGCWCMLWRLPPKQFKEQKGEGYPVEPKSGKALASAFAWTGLAPAFLRAGFQEVARRSPTRPIMRIERNR